MRSKLNQDEDHAVVTCKGTGEDQRDGKHHRGDY